MIQVAQVYGHGPQLKSLGSSLWVDGQSQVGLLTLIPEQQVQWVVSYSQAQHF
jgi:hypothetical protein